MTASSQRSEAARFFSSLQYAGLGQEEQANTANSS
jgi:hypothetical protein